MNAPFVGHDVRSNRQLILYDLATVDDVPESFDIAGLYFVAMLVWDANNSTDDEITVISRRLISAGCAYLCCWGRDCERVHGLFDSEWNANGFDNESDDTIMTTWHDDDTLDEFICFSMLHTEPTNKYQNGCQSVIALVIDDDSLASRIQDAFADPSQIYAKLDG